MVDYYDSFKGRRIDLNPNVVTAISSLNPNSYSSADKGKVTAAARLFALREMMILEMPDRWSDLWLQPLPAPTAAMIPNGLPAATVAIDPAYLRERPALSAAFLRRFRSLYGRINSITNQQNTLAQILSNQSAECLYMVVTMACGDGEARTQFNERDIGDTDGDGAPEFIDAWGHPICFYRWAPGFDSLVQLSYPQLKQIRTNAVANGLDPNAEINSAIAKDHDPFDVYRLQPLAFRLVPLVFSAGRDERLGLELNDDYVPWRKTTAPVVVKFSVYPFFDPVLNPYLTVTSGPGGGTFFGAENTSQQGESADNITNHSLGERLQ